MSHPSSYKTPVEEIELKYQISSLTIFLVCQTSRIVKDVSNIFKLFYHVGISFFFFLSMIFGVVQWGGGLLPFFSYKNNYFNIYIILYKELKSGRYKRLT